MENSETRCPWCKDIPIYVKYHDEEWGQEVHDDRLLFEFLILEGMQAGLSWLTILKRRDAFREAFANFEPSIVATFDENKKLALMQNAGIIRNRAKIHSAVINANKFLEIQKEFGSFDYYIWRFTNGKKIQNNWTKHEDLPCSSPISDQMSKDLKKRGFGFVGTTICYSFMQAIGMVDDHLISCYRRKIELGVMKEG